MPDDDQTLDNDDEQTPGRLRGMYETEKAARAAAEGRLAEMQRKEAFRDAGLDPSKPLHTAVMDAYKGELDTDKVKEYVTSLDLPQPQTDTPPAPPPPPPEDQAALERIASAGAGEGTPPPNPDRDAKERDIRQRMDAASKRGNMAELNDLSMDLARLRGAPVVELQ